MNACVYSCVYECVCIFVCVYMYVHFFCSKSCVHFGTGVLGTSAFAGVYFTQVFFLHLHTHLRAHSLQVVFICVYAGICMLIRIFVYDIA